MLNTLDARGLTAQEFIEADVCIIGGGPAGLGVIRELSGRGLNVCLLESGGSEPPDAALQELSSGEVSGHCLIRLRELSPRQLGGSAHLWTLQLGQNLGLRLRPLDPVTFTKREEVPYSGWPFAKEELEPYYRLACEAINENYEHFNASFWKDHHVAPMSLGQIVETQPFLATTRERFLNLHSGEGVATYTHATALTLTRENNNGRIRDVQVATPGGGRFAVRAKRFVLAAGAVENTRILLASQVGNERVLGRFLMEHPCFRMGLLLPRERSFFDRARFCDLCPRLGTWVQGRLVLTAQTLSSRKVTNGASWLIPRFASPHNWVRWLFPKGRAYLESDAVDAFMEMVRELEAGRFPSLWPYRKRLLKGLLDYCYFRLKHSRHYRFGKGPWGPSQGDWSTLPEAEFERLNFFEVMTTCEQFPHPDNRITLSERLDRHGQRKPHWALRFRQPELENARRMQSLLAQAFAQSGCGQFKPLLEGAYPELYATSLHHPMGTTRMSDDPDTGVVDRHCKVHGVENLYVVSGSVFPTGGYANPTLTILALALRLGRHLRQL